MITDELTEYHHERQMTTLARALEDMKQHKNVCHPSLYITPERREFVYFAHPNMISPANRLVTTESNQNRFSITEPVNLNEVLLNTNMTFALVQGRHYGTAINSLIDNPRMGSQDRAITISTERLDTLFSLVANQRVNATFSYPFELGFFKKQLPIKEDRMISLQVAGIDPYVVGSIGCAKTPWGKAVIENINRVVLKIRDKPEYLKALTTWWEDELLDQRFQEFYQNTFLNSRVEN